MTKYQSDIKTISSSGEVVFGLLSDLNHLGNLNAKVLLENKLKVLEYDADSCLLEVDQIGKIGLNIIEKESFKTIKFATSQLPFEVNAWIQLKQVAEDETKMKLTLSAELPTMVKMMFNKKLEKGINLLADFFENYLNTQLKK